MGSRRAGVSGSPRIRMSDADEAYLIQRTGLLGLFAVYRTIEGGLLWQSGTNQSIAGIF